MLLQQFAQQPLVGPLVTALDQNIENDAGLVDGSPQPMLHTRDLERELANCWPNLRAHWRTVSWLTMMPRAANNSSTMRNPSGKRK